MNELKRPLVRIKLDEGGAVPSDIQISRAGSFFDPRYGNFELTGEMFASFVKNFQAGVRGIDLALDYGHESDCEAAAWFKDVYVQGDGLWAKVDWTPSGKQSVADKEYRYISIEFDFDYADNESGTKFGPTLFGAGLTNRPVIKGLQATTALTEHERKSLMTELEKSQAKVKELEATIKKLSDEMAAMPAPVAPAADDDDDDAAADAELLKQIKELQAQIAQLMSKNNELAAVAAKAEEEKQLSEKTRAFEKMLAEGKAVPAQKEAWLAGDVVKFAELGGKVNLSAGGHGEGARGAGPVGGDVQDQIDALARKALSEDKKLSYSAAVKKVLAENKELAAEYRK